MEYTTAILIFATIFGALVGSFLNVVILRLPKEGASIIFPASHCPKCETQLHWFENIPIISWLILRGKCRTCKVSISVQYPLVELAMALLSFCLISKFQLSIAYVGYFVFGAALLTIIVIDLYHQIIPDVISLPGIIFGFCFSFINPSVYWLDSLIGLFVGGGFLYAIAWAYYILRKQEGMGGGDIKLLAMLGAWLGYQSLLFIVFFSSFTGAIIGIIALKVQKSGANTRIPFGPFLSVAGLVYLFWSVEIQHYFMLYITGQWP